jgi:hypothetical protein
MADFMRDGEAEKGGAVGAGLVGKPRRASVSNR